MQAAPSADFEALYRSQFRYVLRTLLRMGVDSSLVEDLAQEVFVVVHRRLQSYDPERPSKPWLFGITYNVVRAHRRTLRRRPEHVGIEREPGAEDRAFVAGEAARLLHRALATLPVERRAVIALCDLDGESAGEAAAALDISVECVYSRLRRARAELAEAVTALTREPDAPRRRIAGAPA